MITLLDIYLPNVIICFHLDLVNTDPYNNITNV